MPKQRYSLVVFFFLWLPVTLAQTVTGTITGTVVDTSGAAVEGAAVSVHNVALSTESQLMSDKDGTFTATGLLPGTYRLVATRTGFKTAEITSIPLTAGERRAVGTITLEVGQTTEQISVVAEGTAVQTVSAERSGVITTKQVTDLLLIGRDSLDLLRTLPGVADLNTREAPSGFNFNVAVQGNRPGTNNLTLDGVTNLNSGSQSGTWLSPSVDSIAEIKVLLNNYQAEYGRNSGASVNVITKSGSSQFHGGAYYFKRNEALNANDFFFNQRGRPRPRYRYDFGGFNLGGPVLVPGNRDRNRLFFFLSQELMPQSFPNVQNLLTVPTAAERQGDFSATRDQSGRPVTIRDPQTGQPFVGNRIPANRINPNFQKLLNVLPLPNYTDPSGAANYITGDTYRQPRYVTLFRVDYRINQSHNVYFRGIVDNQKTSAGYAAPAQGGNWSLIPTEYNVASRGGIFSLQDTFSPTLIHEFTFGATRAIERVSPLEGAVDRVNRGAIGFGLPQFHPEINDLQLIPNATFGGVPNPANIAFETRYPFFGANNIFDLTDSFTKIAGAHTAKAGIFVQRVQRAAKRASQFNGTFDFTVDANNPLETNWAHANALLGVYKSYSESDARPWGNMRFSNIEWYVQDTWKVNRRLTLDYGLRFYLVPWQYERDDKFSGFDPDRFNPSQAGVLVRPVLNSAGQRVGRNSITGELTPAALIGALAQGNPANGMVVANVDQSYPRGLAENPGLLWGPRFGFAYDPFGTGKTAVRGGFGISYNRENSGTVLPFTENPPLVYTPTSFYGTAADLGSASRVLFPSPVSGLARQSTVPQIMSFSLGVQRDLGAGFVVDVAYAGTLGRHLVQSVNLNGVAPFANFRPENQDPAAPGRPLPPDFLRPYQGLGNINYITYDASSNYHSLQTQMQRRFSHGLQMGAVWTWSKLMTTSDGGQISRYLDQRNRYYGRSSFDRTHIVNVNWVYDLPKVSRFWNNELTRWALDNWQFTGIASFVSGAPLGVSVTTTDGADISGSTNEAIRPDVIASADLPKSERTVTRYFNTAAFARPARGTLGTAARDMLRGPGINNTDIGVFKNFVVKERLRFQFRAEAYNAFNHTQFSDLDLTARFDPTGAQVNQRFGQVISARSPRRIQLALKLSF